MASKTIKDFVFAYIRQQNGVVDPDHLAKEVLAHFPSSKWKNTHWSWYRNQITQGRFRDQFTAEIRNTLSASSRNSGRSGSRIKEHGDRILRDARQAITEAAAGDHQLRFKINRWVFSRLQQDEILQKKPIKQELWDTGIRACQVCGKPFASLKGVDLHRKDSSKPYSLDNCQLLCKLCHKS